MNYMNRKLFKQRPARDKLNKMGGIMASSQSLMESVQKFNLGGNVNIGTQPQINRRNVGVGIPSVAAPTNIGARSGAPPYAQVGRPPTLPYGSQIMDFLGSTFGPETAEERQQRVDLASAIRSRLSRPSDARIRQTAGPFTNMTPGEKIAAISDFFSPKSGTSTAPPATGDIGSAGTRMDDDDPRIQAMIDNTTGPAVPSETIEDFPLGGRRITDPAEIESLLETPEGRAQDGGEMGEGVLSGFTVITGEEPAKTRSGKTKPPPAPVTVTESGLEANASEIKKTTEQLASFLGDPNVSEIEKNDAIMEQFGYKSPEEEIKGLKKRAEINAEMFRDFAGVDPEEDKKIDGYNLAMMGFMIAAGDSPDALQNIAQGMAKGTKMMMDTKKARQERDRQFRIAGLDKAIRDDEKRKELAIQAYNKTQDRRFSLLTDQLRDQRQQQTVLLQLQARENMLKAELQAKAEIARQSNISDVLRAQTTADMRVLESQIEALGPAAALFTAEKGVANVLEGGFGDDFIDFISDPNNLAQAQNLAAIGGKTDGPSAMTPERFAQELLTNREWVDRNQFAAIETLQSQGIEEPTQNQIEAELKRRAAQDATNPITGGASAAPATSQTGFRVGQEVTDGQGRRATVTAVDANGNVTAVTPIQ